MSEQLVVVNGGVGFWSTHQETSQQALPRNERSRIHEWTDRHDANFEHESFSSQLQAAFFLCVSSFLYIADRAQ